MSSARRRYRKPGDQPRWKSDRRFLPKLGSFRPRVGIRIWLTALFLLVTAFAGSLAYDIVRPRLSETLSQAAEANFGQVGEQFEAVLADTPSSGVPADRIQSFATSRNVQWGVVRASDSIQLRGDLEDWNVSAVQKAIQERQPRQSFVVIQSGVRRGQQLATYAAPIEVPGQENTAVVLTKFYPESDSQNVQAAVERVERVALLAGVLALLITGFAGYVLADLIARRVKHLGVAAENLAAGNFDERIHTRLEDEVGSLGGTFNSMAASLKSAFRQVEQEKERSQAILNGMTDAVVGVDNDLNAVFLNPRARELLESTDSGFHNRLQEILAKTRYSGPITEPEVETASQVFEIRATPLEEGAVAILRDVTQERRVDRAKAEFIANASHELKTPLFALSGYLEMLEDEEDENVRSAFLDDMRAQTGRLQNLARTLLDLSRLDANAVTFRLEEVDLTDMLHELRRDFSYTGRPVNINAEETLPPVETDPTQLHRMLAILLDNALKYSGEDSPVDLGLQRMDGHAVVSVADRGCGIPESEIPHIFDRFYRAQGSSRADGTGLGLALASEIADHLGGDIRVESDPESGSTFSVTLPLSEDHELSNEAFRNSESNFS